MSRVIKFIDTLRWLIAKWSRVVLLTAVVTISYLAFSKAPQLPPSVSFGDKFNHFFAFFVLSFLVHNAYKQKSFLWKVIIVMAYALLIEIVQSLLPHRSAEWLDVLADFIGVLLFIVVYRIYLFVKIYYVNKS